MNELKYKLKNAIQNNDAKRKFKKEKLRKAHMAY